MTCPRLRRCGSRPACRWGVGRAAIARRLDARQRRSADELREGEAPGQRAHGPRGHQLPGGAAARPVRRPGRLRIGQRPAWRPVHRGRRSRAVHRPGRPAEPGGGPVRRRRRRGRRAGWRRPDAAARTLDLLWDFGGYRAGVSVSNVRFPSGQINSTQFGLVLGMNTEFKYLPSGRDAVPFSGSGRTGVGMDRMLAVGGVYPPAGGRTGRERRCAESQIGTVGVARRAVLHAESLRRHRGQWCGQWRGGRLRRVPRHARRRMAARRGSLLPRRAIRARHGGRRRHTRRRRLARQGGARRDAALLARPEPEPGNRLGKAPQGSLSAPFGSLALRWDLDHPHGADDETDAPGIHQRRRDLPLGGAQGGAAAEPAERDASSSIASSANRSTSPARCRAPMLAMPGAFSVGLFGLGRRDAPRRQGGCWAPNCSPALPAVVVWTPAAVPSCSRWRMSAST